MLQPFMIYVAINLLSLYLSSQLKSELEQLSVELQTKFREVFTIMDEAPTSTIGPSLLKAILHLTLC